MNSAERKRFNRMATGLQRAYLWSNPTWDHPAIVAQELLTAEWKAIRDSNDLRAVRHRVIGLNILGSRAKRPFAAYGMNSGSGAYDPVFLRHAVRITPQFDRRSRRDLALAFIQLAIEILNRRVVR